MTVRPRLLLGMLAAVTVAACGDSGERPTSRTAQQSPPSDAPTPSFDDWLGRWVGPEGTYLDLRETADGYRVEIRSLDGVAVFEGRAVAEGIAFERNGTIETVPAPAERTADAPAVVPTGGSLRVVTTNLRAGYLRKNGVPYSEDAVLTEHWALYKRPNGEEYLTITTQVDDPEYLRTARLVAPVFKKEPNSAKWDPTPCSSVW